MPLATEHLAVTVPAGPVELEADLTFPPDPVVGVVAFAHGSGSSRRSSRNRHVASRLHDEHLATLLLDLLTPEEAQVDSVSAEFRFDIDLLATRMTYAVDFLATDPHTRSLAVGLFGASTGAAAALRTAAERPEKVRAVVSRGGRPDLAGDALPRVRCPVLLIVGGLDFQVIELNERAVTQMRCPKELLIVPGATHLFEEPGTLDQVAGLAASWFQHHLSVKAETRTTGRR
jgi:pimeloyl-ACP methyl ester carboxylesterase